MKVTIIKNTVQTGEHYGKKGQTLDVPEPIARHWIEIRAAVLPGKNSGHVPAGQQAGTGKVAKAAGK